jgi:hypothetical protein
MSFWNLEIVNLSKHKKQYYNLSIFYWSNKILQNFIKVTNLVIRVYDYW